MRNSERKKGKNRSVTGLWIKSFFPFCLALPFILNASILQNISKILFFFPVLIPWLWYLTKEEETNILIYKFVWLGFFFFAEGLQLRPIYSTQNISLLLLFPIFPLPTIWIQAPFKHEHLFNRFLGIPNTTQGDDGIFNRTMKAMKERKKRVNPPSQVSWEYIQGIVFYFLVKNNDQECLELLKM